MGGEVLYAGKPYRPIYELALAKAEAALGRKADPRRVLAIGDSVRTDLAGAHAFGIDCLFVTAGIHADELGGRGQPEAHAISGLVRRRRANAEGGDAAACLVGLRTPARFRRRGTPRRSCS